MTPTTVKLTAAGAALALATSGGFGAAWRWRTNDITQLELNHANERIASQRAARVEAERRVATQRAADLKAQVRVRSAAADRVQLDALGSGLRLATADTVRASSENPAACAVHAAALGDVFSQCSARLIEVATTLDLWVAEAVKQNEAAQ